MITRHRVCVVAVWLAFLVRGAFYCVEQPLWEGYDEWAHFAYLQHLAEHGSLPSRQDAVSPFVDRSLQLAPLSRSAAEVGPGAITHDLFWQLPEDERARRQEELFRLTPATPLSGEQIFARQYEAQQPPLYYFLLSPAYMLAKTLSLPTQVLLLRLLSMAIASCVIFLAYSIANHVLHRQDLAVLTAILAACLPGLFIDVCRIGNDPLAIVLIAAMVLVSIRACYRPPGALEWIGMGLLFGAGALAKAYALAVWPLLPLVAGLLLAKHPERWKRTALGFGLASVAAIAVAGSWYGQILITTGTLSGEQLHVAAGGLTLAEKFAALSAMDWPRVVDSAAFSHIWVGGWSFLVVRSWMYRLFEVIALLGAAGLAMHAVRIVRHSSWKYAQDLLIPLVAVIMMYAALAYHSLMIFLEKNVSMGAGWYLYSVVAAEVVLLALGIRAVFPVKASRWALAAVCWLAAALDLYTMHFLLMPYHSGLIRHDASGSLASFKLPMLESAGLFQRISLNKPLDAGSIGAFWLAYLCATVGLFVLAALAATGGRQSATPQNGKSRLAEAV